MSSVSFRLRPKPTPLEMYTSTYYPDRRKGKSAITRAEFDSVKKIATDTQYTVDTAVINVDVGGNPTVLPSVRQQLATLAASQTATNASLGTVNTNLGTLTTTVGNLSTNLANVKPTHLGSSNLSITQDGVYTAMPMEGGSILPYRYGYTYFPQSGLGDGLSYVNDGFPYAGTGVGHILNVSGAVRAFVITNLGSAPMYMVWDRNARFRYYRLAGIFNSNPREVPVNQGFAYPLLPYHTYMIYSTPEDNNLVIVYQTSPNIPGMIN